jgi:hypothetical protein
MGLTRNYGKSFLSQIDHSSFETCTKLSKFSTQGPHVCVFGFQIAISRRKTFHNFFLRFFRRLTRVEANEKIAEATDQLVESLNRLVAAARQVLKADESLQQAAERRSERKPRRKRQETR